MGVGGADPMFLKDSVKNNKAPVIQVLYYLLPIYLPMSIQISLKNLKLVNLC
jgi:hypothetical protein